jgi:biopolymer transport protein TolR
MSMSTGGGGAAVKAEPNVTPMIDVMLVLLIIFMIVVPAINAGFNAVPPDAQNLKLHPEEETDQVLGIDADGKYYLNKKPIRNEDLPAAVKDIFSKTRDDYIMYVKAHKGLQYVKVLDAIDILSHNGVHVAALITEQIPGTESLVEADHIKPANSK